MASIRVTRQYSRPYFLRISRASRCTVAGSVTTWAVPSIADTPSRTLPKRLLGGSRTRGFFWTRLTFQLSAGVHTNSSAPSRPIHMGVDTPSPLRLYVVSDTKRCLPRVVVGSLVTASKVVEG